MSRSYRKTPVFGHTSATSEKADKVQAHHNERTRVRTALHGAPDLEALVLPDQRQAYSNVYSFAKDGKAYSSVRVVHEGRALHVLAKPQWLKTDRDVHKAMGK